MMNTGPVILRKIVHLVFMKMFLGFSSLAHHMAYSVLIVFMIWLEFYVRDHAQISANPAISLVQNNIITLLIGQLF